MRSERGERERRNQSEPQPDLHKVADFSDDHENESEPP